MIDERALEAAARAECIAEGVDPELQCGSAGRQIPPGEIWPAWKVRMKRMAAAIEAYEAALWRPIEEIARYGGQWVMIAHPNPNRFGPHTALVDDDHEFWNDRANAYDMKGAMFRTITPPPQAEGL